MLVGGTETGSMSWRWTGVIRKRQMNSTLSVLDCATNTPTNNSLLLPPSSRKCKLQSDLVNRNLVDILIQKNLASIIPFGLTKPMNFIGYDENTIVKIVFICIDLYTVY